MLIIDRFEGEFAVCEHDGEMINIPRSLILGDAQEGDVLKQVPEGYVVDDESKAARRKRIEDLMKSLWR